MEIVMFFTLQYVYYPLQVEKEMDCLAQMWHHPVCS